MKPTQLIEKILGLSKADDCIVIVEEASNVNVRWANNTTTTNGAVSTFALIIIAIRDKRVGIVHRSYIDEQRLEALAREAETSCEFREPAEDYAELESGDDTASDWDAPTVTTSVAVFDKLSRDLPRAFQKTSKDDRLLFGYAEHSSTTLWVANSRGLRKRHDQQSGQIEITAKTSDFKSSSWVGQATTDFKNVDVTDMVGRLQQRLDWSQTKLEIPAGHYDTLLEPSAVADLLTYAYWTASDRDAAEGRTVFSEPGGKTKVGKRLTEKNVTIYSDPNERDLVVSPFAAVGGSSAFASIFDNGTEVKKTKWVENGVLKHLITPRYWAKKQDIPLTPYVDNLIMQTDGTGSIDDMIKDIKRGLLVTCLWYIREVDPQHLLLTGLTRDGVYLIEDGKVKGVVNNFRFNMSPVGMLGDIQASGSTVPTLAREFGDFFTFTKVPPLVIHNFNMSSISQAT